jgi:hypothetical protein
MLAGTSPGSDSLSVYPLCCAKSTERSRKAQLNYGCLVAFSWCADAKFVVAADVKVVTVMSPSGETDAVSRWRNVFRNKVLLKMKPKNGYM